jgi:hypothetical protein
MQSPAFSDRVYVLWGIDRHSLGFKMFGAYKIQLDCITDKLWFEANFPEYIYTIGETAWNSGGSDSKSKSSPK